MSHTNHSLTSPSPNFPPVSLKKAAKLISVDYAVLKQSKRRALLGLVDCPAPSWNLDRRVRFVTGESVMIFLANKAIRQQISQLTLAQMGSYRYEKTQVGIALR